MFKTVSNAVTLAAGNGADLPSVNDFLPPEILFQGTPFAINRIMLVRIVATLVLLVVLGITAAHAKLIPGRWQAFIEWGISFIQNSVVYEIMGELRGRRYVPMIVTLFFTILVFNVCGVIPGANIAATATIAMPLVFALWTLYQYWAAGIREKGLWGFIRDECFTPGVPPFIYVLLAPVQLFEIVIVRPLSLTIRLFANMVSGHLVLATCLAFANYWIVEFSNKLAGIPVGGLWLVGGLVMTLFELFVAFLQAYVFAILSTAYINLSYPEN